MTNEAPNNEKETTAKPELRPFGKTDWYGWGGAEHGPNGEIPQICETKTYIIIASNDGVDLVLPQFDPLGNVTGFLSYTHGNEASYHANVLLARGYLAAPTTVLDEVVAMGFKFSHEEKVVF